MSDALIPYPAERVTPKTFDAYCEEVPSFEASEFAASERNRRRCFLGMCVFGGLSGLLGTALYGASRENTRLARGFEVRPVLVDKSTGESFQIKKVEGLPEGAAEIHTKHMLWFYVMRREGYSAVEDKQRFEDVLTMSDPAQQRLFKKWWEEDRDGPRVELTRAGTAEVRLRAEVELRREDPKATKGPYTHAVCNIARTLSRPYHETTTKNMLITIYFAWDDEYARADDRHVNPFGLVVHRYIRSEQWA